MSVPTSIRDLRKSRNLSVAELAAAVGVDRKTITRYESGRFAPNGHNLQKLATVLGVSAGDIELPKREQVA